MWYFKGRRKKYKSPYTGKEVDAAVKKAEDTTATAEEINAAVNKVDSLTVDTAYLNALSGRTCVVTPNNKYVNILRYTDGDYEIGYVSGYEKNITIEHLIDDSTYEIVKDGFDNALIMFAIRQADFLTLLGTGSFGFDFRKVEYEGYYPGIPDTYSTTYVIPISDFEALYLKRGASPKHYSTQFYLSGYSDMGLTDGMYQLTYEYDMDASDHNLYHATMLFSAL